MPNGKQKRANALYLHSCTIHLYINVYVHQLMHLFISLRKL